jgi:RNase P subunit RPR2
MHQRRFRMICRHCGSKLVTRDAWAEWDEDQQAWVLRAVYDHAYCHKCDEETRIEELPL